MDRHSLERLAADGIAAFPPSQLASLADWCWDFSEATGDARYSSLSCTVRMIAQLFADENYAPPVERVAAIDAALRQYMPEVLQAADAASGAVLARSLRETIQVY